MKVRALPAIQNCAMRQLPPPLTRKHNATATYFQSVRNAHTTIPHS